MSFKPNQSRSSSLLIRLPLKLLNSLSSESADVSPPATPLYVDLERTGLGWKPASTRPLRSAKPISSASEEESLPRKPGPRQYVCEVEGCSKRFLDNSKLRRHMLVHTVGAM